MNLIILLLLFYLIGSIPTGYIISHLKGVDIKKVGSGNIGGTNVGRALGKKYGILVVLLDVLKGFLPLVILRSFYPDYTLIFGIILIIGHIFSVFLKFKGGKGVATMIGVALCTVSISYVAVFTIIWIVCIYRTKYMSLSNLIIIWGFPVYYILFNKNPVYLLLSLIIVGFLYYGHRENIKRLITHTEKKLF